MWKVAQHAAWSFSPRAMAAWGAINQSVLVKAAQHAAWCSLCACGMHKSCTTSLMPRAMAACGAGACWDCMELPTDETQESPEPLMEAVNASNGSLREGLSELIRVMTEFRELVGTVNVDEPWLTPNAEELDSMTFQDWVSGTGSGGCYSLSPALL